MPASAFFMIRKTSKAAAVYSAAERELMGRDAGLVKTATLIIYALWFLGKHYAYVRKNFQDWLPPGSKPYKLAIKKMEAQYPNASGEKYYNVRKTERALGMFAQAEAALKTDLDEPGITETAIYALWFFAKFYSRIRAMEPQDEDMSLAHFENGDG